MPPALTAAWSSAKVSMTFFAMATVMVPRVLSASIAAPLMPKLAVAFGAFSSVVPTAVASYSTVSFSVPLVSVKVPITPSTLAVKPSVAFTATLEWLVTVMAGVLFDHPPSVAPS